MAKRRTVIFLYVSGFFFVLGILGNAFLDKPVTGNDLANQISIALECEIARADIEALQLMNNPLDTARWDSVKNSFYLVDMTGVKAWSNNDFVPDFRVAFEPFSIKFLKIATGDFLLKKWPLPDQSFLLLVIPLHKVFSIDNNYLSPDWNKSIFEFPVKIDELASKNGSSVCLAKEGCVFAVSPDTATAYESSHRIAFFAFLISITFLLIFLILSLWKYHRKGEYQKTFLGLAITLSALRIGLVELNFPNALIKFHLFDPRQFASSSFNASMGDLFLNSLVVLLLCIYLFNYYSGFNIMRWVLRAGRWQQAGVSVLCLFICFLALLFPYLYIEIIHHNSSLSLGITNSLTFESTRIVAYLSLLQGCTSSFLMTHIFIRLALRLSRSSGSSFLLLLASSAILFVAFFLAGHRSYWITLGLGCVYFAILYLVKLAVPLTRLTFKSFLYFLVAVIVLSLQGTLSVRRFQEEKKIDDLFRYGSNILVDQDVLGEFLLNESIHRIAKDPFIQFRLSTPFLSKASVGQKVKLVYLNSYFDRYDIQVYLYNAKGEPYDKSFAPDFATSVRNYQRDPYKTIYPDIYFVNNPSPRITKKYLAMIPVSRLGVVFGFVVLDLTLKKIIPQDVYPELLVDNRFSRYVGNRAFSYAYYSQGRLTSSFGGFNYEKYFDRKFLTDDRLFHTGVKDNEYSHVGIQDKSGQVAVVTTVRYPIFFMITNFSFFFILGLGVLLLFLSITGIISWVRGTRLNYSSRIQLYVYLAFFFPLVAVSITTLSLISRSDEDQLTNEYGEKARMLSEKISFSLQQLGTINQSDFQNTLTELAQLSNVDASVYSVNGVLLASSQPAIFENHLLSHLMNRDAWTSIVGFRENLYIANEKIGKLLYNCSYAAIKSPETGKLIGVLSIPFFSSASSFEQSKINALANILTVFVIIFILFSFLSFIVANGLTFPLRFITQSLQKTTLNDTNKLIVWNSKDEIGLLANEYNRMVQNLEQSKMELVRSQKESAWREIAKQVAHEIKNPLTPMKLTLQQWEQELANGEVFSEKAKKSIGILLTQLETLNDIAGSFSAFARMPSPLLHRIELVKLLKQVVDLHATLQDGSVVVLEAAHPIFILGDDLLLGRIFSNLILNALQSGKEGEAVIVQVKVTVHGSKSVIEVKDNGKGIDEKIRERVFLPHFSTKKTGSGLGLAIAWQGIEQSGGRIWFETETGKGTTFFIEFPLADNV